MSDCLLNAHHAKILNDTSDVSFLVKNIVTEKRDEKLKQTVLNGKLITETLELPGVFVPYPEDGSDATDQRLPPSKILVFLVLALDRKLK